VSVAPLGDEVVQMLNRPYAANEIDEEAEEDAAGERAHECERQEKTGGDAGVQSLNEQTAKRGVRPDSLADDARSLERRTSRNDGRTGVPLHGEERRKETCERCEEIDEQRYGESFPGVSAFTGGVRITAALVSVSRM
jgi:hypothetical protein